MKVHSIKHWIALLVATSAVGISGAGCAAQSSNSTDAPAATPTVTISEELTIRRDDLVVHVVHALRNGSSAMVAHVYNKSGVQLYDTVYQWGTTFDKIRFRHRADMKITVMKTKRDAAMSLPTFGAAALFMFTEVDKKVVGGVKYDNQGCDSPAGDLTCGSGVGACCDTHDACYAQYGCTAWSWLGTIATVGLGATVSDCVACNTSVVGCMAGSSPGDAACCSEGTCGQPHSCGDGSGSSETAGDCDDPCADGACDPDPYCADGSCDDPCADGSCDDPGDDWFSY